LAPYEPLCRLRRRRRESLDERAARYTSSPSGCRVRSRLAAGGRRIRTAGPTSKSAQPRHRPDVANRQHPSWISNPCCLFNQPHCRKWDRRFESAFLQRGVTRERSEHFARGGSGVGGPGGGSRSARVHIPLPAGTRRVLGERLTLVNKPEPSAGSRLSDDRRRPAQRRPRSWPRPWLRGVGLLIE
jgi:hypothetical protein